MPKVYKKDLLYPELSYRVVGILYEVSKTLGPGFLEKYYQKAIATHLDKAGLKFKEQATVKLIIDDKVIAKGIVDFIIDDKIILEIKKGDKFQRQNIDQLHSYLKITGLQLGMLANFTSKGAEFKRIVNIINQNGS